MKTMPRALIMLTILIFTLTFSSCGTKIPTDIMSNDDNYPEQSGLQNHDEVQNPPADEASGSGVLTLLQNPKAPANYTFEKITESKQDKGTGYERVTRKDSIYLIETIPYEGPDQGKTIGYKYCDIEAQIHKIYDVKTNTVTEGKGSGIEGLEDAYDLEHMYKFIINMIPQEMMGNFIETGEEDVEGYPCRVFEMSEFGKITLFISKQYNVILKYTLMDHKGTENTFILRGFRAGSVTDDMVKLSYPADAKVQ